MFGITADDNCNIEMFIPSAMPLRAAEVVACTEHALDMFMNGSKAVENVSLYRRLPVELDRVTHWKKYHNPRPTLTYINPETAPTLMSVVDGIQEKKEQAVTYPDATQIK